ncbi:neural proliferation differentiation and control protein 1a isoform X2 [Trichomycterus rosablanca]|uniref:neural proliferation differentiation and control protein 1a isoform X2 n=1 Tax=Trichomycterus rosablanca TaxID=2290929 RepID=UPI002F350F07
MLFFSPRVGIWRSRRWRFKFSLGLLLCVVTVVGASAPGKETSLPDIDDEIDFLSSVIAKQQVSNIQPTALKSATTKTQPHLKNASNFTTVQSATHKPAITTSKHPETHTSASRISKPFGVIFPSDSLLVILMSTCVLMGTLALILAGVYCIWMQRERRLAEKVDYPAFYPVGSSSSSSNSSGDKKLAHCAQMYHYQHQKQQMLSMERHKAEPKVSENRAASDEETEEGDFTVYECPGLAPTGEMEVKNPLFDDTTLQKGRNHKE